MGNTFKPQLNPLNSEITLGITLAVFFWISDSLLHVLFLKSESFFSSMFAPPWHEVWVRGMVISFIMLTFVVNWISRRRNLKLEARAQAEKEKTRHYLDAASVIFVVLDTDQYVLHINRTGCELLGLEEAEIVGQKWFDNFISHQDRTKGLSAFRKLIEGEDDSFLYHENAVVGKQGNEQFIAWHNSLLLDENGEVAGVISSGEDVTYRRLTEAALAETHKTVMQERNMFIRGPVVVFKWQNKEKWPVEYVSPNVADILGYAPGEWLSEELSYADIIAREDLDRFTHEVVSNSSSGIGNFEHDPYRILTKDGRKIWVADFTTIIRDDNEEITHYLGYIIDITEHREAVEDLRVMSSVVEQSSEGMCITDLSGTLISVNRAWQQLHGRHARKELIQGLHLREFIACDGDIVDNLLTQTKNTGSFRGEIDHVREDGTVFPTMMYISVLRDSKNVPTALAVTANDITERRQAEIERENLARFPSEDPSPVLRITEAGEILYANAASKPFLRSWNCDVGEKIPDFLKLHVSQTLTEGKIKQIEIEEEKKSVLFTLVPVENEDYVNLYGMDITKLKRAEEARRASEKQYRSVVQTASDAIITIDRDRKIVSWNRGAAEIFGLSARESIGESLSVILPPKYRQNLDNELEQALNKGKYKSISKPIEMTGLNKDGNEFPIELSLAVWKTAKQVFVTLIIRDVTERKIAELAIIESEEKFRLLSEQSILGIIILQDDLLKYVNEAASEIFESPANKLLESEPLEWMKFIYPDDVAFVSEQAKKKQRGEKDIITNYVLRLITTDGKLKWVEIYSKTVNYNGKPADLVSIIDITEKRKAEEALKQSEERFRGIFYNAAIGIYHTTPQGEILDANPKLVEMLGYSSLNELQSNNLENGFHSEDAPRSLFTKLIEKQGRVYGLESEWLKKDGSILYVRENATAVRDQDGKTLYYEGTVEDITESRRAEKVQNVLYHIAQATNTAPDLDGLLTTIHKQLGELIDTTNYYVALYDRETGTYSFPYCVDENESENTLKPQKLNNSLTDYIRRTGKPLIVDTETHERLLQEEAIEVIGVPSETWMGVPLKTTKGCIGVVAVHSYKDQNAFTENDLELLVIVSENIAQAIERKQAEEQVQWQSTILNATNQILLETLTCETEEDVAQMCLLKAQELTGSAYGFIGEANQQGTFDVIAISQSGRGDCKMPKSRSLALLKNMKMRGVWSKALKTEKAHIVSDLQSDPDRVGTPEGHPAINNLLCVPLKRSGQTFGVIALANKEKGYVFEDQRAVEALSISFVEALNRKRAEEALSVEKTYLERLFESAPEAIILVDNDSRVLRVNGEFTRMFDYTAEEAVGKSIDELLAPSELRKEALDLTKQVASGKGVALESVRKRKDGTLVDVSILGTPIKIGEGQVAVYAIYRDISERKKTEEALAFERKQLLSIFDSIDEIVYVSDPDTYKLLYINQAGRQKFGDVLGRKCHSALYNFNKPCQYCHNEVLFGEKEGEALTYEFHNTSNDRWYRCMAKAINWPDGRKVRYEMAIDITDSKQAVERIREAETKYRTLFSKANDAIILMDDDVFIDCNAKALEMFGCERDQLISHSPYEFSPVNQPDGHNSIKKAKQKIQAALKGKPQIFYWKHKRADESLFDAEVSLNTWEFNGKPYIQAIVRDVTERTRAEKSREAVLNINQLLLRELDLEKMLRGLSDQLRELVPHDLLTLSLIQKEHDQIEAYLKVNRVKKGGKKARPAIESYQKNLKGSLTQQILQHKRNNIASRIPVRGTELDKKFSDLKMKSFIALPLVNVGIPLGMLYLAGEKNDAFSKNHQEFLEQMQSQFVLWIQHHRIIEKLSDSEAKYRSLFENSNDAIYILQDKRFIFINRKFEELLGYSLDEVNSPAFDFIQLVAPESVPFIEERTRRLLAGEVLPSNYQFKGLSKSGKIMDFDVSVSYITFDGGIATQGILRDVSERKRFEEKEKEMQLELMQQSKLASIGMLAAGIAHNLNVPLQGISSHIELLKMTRDDVPYLDIILQQVQRISAIINNMLFKSRQEQDQSKREIDLNQLLIEELTFLDADLMFKHDIEKEYHLDPNLPQIHGIYSDFSQGLLNIIKNAIDAMYESEVKKLCVRTKRLPDNNILIEIKDTGYGIPGDKIDLIFNPFFTTKPATGEAEDGHPVGTGLGLSSTYQLLKKYDAKFDIDSEEEKGTTFRVYLDGNGSVPDAEVPEPVENEADEESILVEA